LTLTRGLSQICPGLRHTRQHYSTHLRREPGPIQNRSYPLVMALKLREMVIIPELALVHQVQP